MEGSPQVFWYCETKTIDRITIPLLSENFETRIILKHRRVLPRWFLAMWDKKIDKIVIPLLCKNVWYQNISETQKGWPTLFFGDLGQKNIDGKKWHPLLIHELFPYWNFSERQKRSPTKFIGTVRLKVLHGKTWNSAIMHETFGCPNFFESLEAAPQIFPHCETKTNDRIVKPLLSKNFWYQNSILKNRRVRLRCFSAIWDKKNFEGKTWDPPSLIHKLFP